MGLVVRPGVPLSRTPWGFGGPQNAQMVRVISDQCMLRVAPWGPSLLAPWVTTLGPGVCEREREREREGKRERERERDR